MSMYLKLLLNFINKNNDDIIQKEEIQEFLKTQKNSDSIFAKYVSEDTPIDDLFKKLSDNFANKKPEIPFNNQDAKEYKEYSDYYVIYGVLYTSDQDFGKDFKKFKDILKIEKEKYKEPEKLNEEEMQKIYIKAEQETFLKRVPRIETKNELTKKIMDNPNIGKQCTEEVLNTIMSRMSTGNFVWPWYLQNVIFPDFDFSKYPEVLKNMQFYEYTFEKVSSNHLPEDFDPKKIFEDGKSIGLNIENVHKMGYTGNGIKFAVIDSGTICNNGKQHQALKFKEYNVAKSDFKNGKPVQGLNGFHGQAVSYIAQQIAPNADLYYYAQDTRNTTALIENLQSIIDKNKELKNEGKDIIRVLSLSFDVKDIGEDKALAKIKELEEQGVIVFSADNLIKVGNNITNNLGILEKKNKIEKDKNDIFANYQKYQGKQIMLQTDENTLYVNSGDRTVPDPESETSFRHDVSGSVSWSIPVIAGYYILACQADSTMNKDKFWQLARETAHTIDSPVVDSQNPNNIIKKNIKVIDIKALLEKINKQNKINM